MADLRYYGFKIQVENSEGVKKVTQFRKAVSDVDDTVDMLNATLGDNVTVTAEKTQSDKEATAQAKLLITQQERQNRKTQAVTDQYQSLITTMKTYGNDAETVNAITRLGTNATEAQKTEVARLVAEYQQLRNVGDAGSKSMRKWRGVAQNFGWQLQDTVVQLQMGTNAFTVFSQQGSQMASAFGAWGAIIGAGIAVVGAVIPSLTSYLSSASKETDNLKTAQEDLNKIFDQTEYTVKGVNKQINELYNLNKDLAQLKLVGAMAEAQQALANYKTQIRDTVGDSLQEVGRLQEGIEALQQQGISDSGAFSGIKNANESIKEIADSLGITTEQVLKLSDAYTTLNKTGDATALTDQLVALSKNSKKLTPEMGKLVAKYSDLAAKQELTKAQLKELNAILTGQKTVTGSYNGTLKDTVTITEKYTQKLDELGLSQNEVARERALNQLYTKDGLKMSDEELTYAAALINTYFDEKNALDAKAAARKKLEAAQKAQLNSLAREYAKVKDTEDDDDSDTNADAVTKVNNEHQRRLSVLQDYYTKVKGLRAEDLSNNTEYNADIAKEDERYTTARNQAYLKYASGLADTFSSTETMMSKTVDLFSTGVDDVKEATEGMNAAQKAMYLASQTIAAAQAIISGINLGMQLAAYFPLAAPEMLLTGTALGAAEAGAIMGTTIAGAFDDGGKIPAGQSGIVAEYGDELVNGVMVKGPARVTSREDTAKMMNGNNNQAINHTTNVNVQNSIPGGNYSVSQLSNGDVKVIAKQVFNDNIDGGVAGVLSQKGTKSDKAMRSNYKAPRKYSR